MKKLLVTLLILGIAAGAFAQVKATLTADFNPDVFKYTSNTGDDAKSDIGGSEGSLDLLSGWGLRKGNEVRLQLTYTGENISGSIRLALDRLFRPTTNINSHSFMDSETRGDFTNGNNVTPNDILSSNFNLWWAQGNWDTPVAGFTAWIGNDAKRGKTDRLSPFDDYLKNKIDNYGVIAPAVGRSVTRSRAGFGIAQGNGTANRYEYIYDYYRYEATGFGTIETNNFNPGVNAGAGNTNDYRIQDEAKMGSVNRPYFLLSANFAPFTFEVAGDVGNNSGIMAGTLKDYSRINGGFRFSGDKVGSIVSFDAIYKYRGGDVDTGVATALTNVFLDPNINYNPWEPDGRGYAVHSFGAFANLWIIDNFDIGVGYSGIMRSYEDRNASGTMWARSAPMLQGMDLRFRFTGVDKLTVALHNNVSFAFGDPSSDVNHKEVIGFDGLVLPDKVQESWLALYNALGVNYSLTPALTAAFQVSNRIGWYSIENGNAAYLNSKLDQTVEQFAATAFASLKVNNNVTVAAGLIVQFNNTSITPNTEAKRIPGSSSFWGSTPTVTSTAQSTVNTITSAVEEPRSYGTMTIGLPVRLLLTF
jgi:hypothetical protein